MAAPKDKTALVERLRSGPPLTTDGPMGTSLRARGLPVSSPPERWNLDRPRDVEAVTRSFVEAGAEIVHTNTFGASPLRLGHFGLEGQAQAINAAAVRIARDAAGKAAWVVGSLGPSGLAESRLTVGDAAAEHAARQAFGQQALFLAESGADALVLETMVDLNETLLALAAAKRSAPNLPIFVSFAFMQIHGAWSTPVGGTPPADAVRAVIKAEADAVGANCCEGAEGILGIAHTVLNAAGDLPVLLRPSAGLPRDGVWPETAQVHGRVAAHLFDMGIRAVGCCCGATPAHVAAVHAAASRIRSLR